MEVFKKKLEQREMENYSKKFFFGVRFFSNKKSEKKGFFGDLNFSKN